MKCWVLALIAFLEAFLTAFLAAMSGVWTVQGAQWPPLSALAFGGAFGALAGFRRLSAFLKIPTALLLLVALTGCATLAEERGHLVTVIRADVQRGLEMATAAQDPAGIACAAAILKHLPDGGPVLVPAGAFSALMAARELRRRVSAGLSEEIHIACAPLIVDAERTLLRLGITAVK